MMDNCCQPVEPKLPAKSADAASQDSVFVVQIRNIGHNEVERYVLSESTLLLCTDFAANVVQPAEILFH